MTQQTSLHGEASAAASTHRDAAPPRADDAPARSPRGWIGLLVAIAFTAGVAAGAAGARVLSSEEAYASGPRTPQQRAERVITHMVKELALDAREEAQVRAVFERWQPRFEAVFAQFRPEMERLRGEVRGEVRAGLPPEKQVAFDRMVAEEDAQRAP